MDERFFMNRTFAVIFIIVCFATALAKIGEMDVLSSLLEERIKSRRPEWALLNKHVDDDAGVFQWQDAPPEKEIYVVIIKNKPSIAVAAKDFAEIPLRVSSGDRGVEIQGIGRGARLWEIKRGSQISIEFWQENFVVSLLAPSEPKGKRLAKYVVDSIDALQRRK
jgi:hypothetical protein